MQASSGCGARGRGARLKAALPLAVFLGPVLALSACRGILGIDPLPGEDAASDASDAGHERAHHEAGPVDASADVTSPFTVVMGTPLGEILNAITGWDKDHFIAVGTSNVSYVYTEGSFQRLGGDQQGDDLYGVWGTSPGDVYAVGTHAIGGGYVQHYDGSAWTTVFESPTGLYGVWGDPAGQGVLAVGESGTFYGYHSGSSWQKLATVPPNPDTTDAKAPLAPILSSITGRSLDDFTITASGDRFFHWEPEAGGLAYYDPTLPPTTNFTAAWQDPAATRTSVYLGSNFFGLLWFTAPDKAIDASLIGFTNGYALAGLYSDKKTPGSEQFLLQGIWGTPAKVVAVGSQGRILVFDVASVVTTVVPAPSGSTAALGGVWGSSLSDVWIVGFNELFYHGSVE